MGQLPGRTFAEQIANWATMVRAKQRAIWVDAGTEVLRSIQEGSEITGAPGQPVGQYGEGYNQGAVGGTLKASWQRWFPTEHTQIVATNIVYARPNEDGVSPTGGSYVQRSTVGGRFSVALTRAGWPLIVAHVAKAHQK